MFGGESNTVMSDMESWCSFYAAKGLVYFPIYGITNGICRCAAGIKCGANTGKHPVYKWKGQPARCPRPTDNMGISTENLVVIDLDGDVSETTLDDYPRTFTTSTGHGYHLWYRADPTKPVKSVVGWKHKVDVRAIGGLIIAPPSRHRNGSVYRHVRGDSIQPVPRDLLDSLPEKGNTNRRMIGHEVTDLVTETPSVFTLVGRRFIEDVASTTEARNQRLFWIGCRYFEFAAKGILGADVLTDIFQAALNSGLTAEEIERTLDSARKSV